jgi:hypothetical protein
MKFFIIHHLLKRPDTYDSKIFVRTFEKLSERLRNRQDVCILITLEKLFYYEIFVRTFEKLSFEKVMYFISKILLTRGQVT